MKKAIKFFLIFLILVICSGCSISHKYGPYKGKVVDKETGEPIGGAVVFIRFYTEFPSPGGAVSNYADAIEVLTDADGKFNIPAYRVKAFRMLHYWSDYAPVIIFKPGYGAYPGHRDVAPRFGLAGGIPENEVVIIKLPKLTTLEERKENLYNADAYNSWKIPYEKQKYLSKFIDSEREKMGFKPYRSNMGGRVKYEYKK